MTHLDEVPNWVRPLRYRGPQRPTDLRIALCLIAALVVGAALGSMFLTEIGALP